MQKSPFSAWGRHVDDELVGVVPVVVNFGCVVPIEVDVGEIWGAATPRQLLIITADMQAFGQARCSPEHSVHVWELPGLRFDTIHGSVVVVDRYNDTEFAFLRSKEGRRALRINTPLRNVAALTHWGGGTDGIRGGIPRATRRGDRMARDPAVDAGFAAPLRRLSLRCAGRLIH